ncbi:hypothetical protein DFJ77DRAFT_155077 [Powellomyces hirtus]|nr:hypothetical protein DFJ77DRAFT_155077 [Powellomyces hirtus]
MATATTALLVLQCARRSVSNRQRSAYALFWFAVSRPARRCVGRPRSTRSLHEAAFCNTKHPAHDEKCTQASLIAALLRGDALSAVDEFIRLQTNDGPRPQLDTGHLRQLQGLLEAQPQTPKITSTLRKVLRYLLTDDRWSLSDYQSFLRCSVRRLSSEQAGELVGNMLKSGLVMDAPTLKLLFLTLRHGKGAADLCLYLHEIQVLGDMKEASYKPVLQLVVEIGDLESFSTIMNLLRNRGLFKTPFEWLAEMEVKLHARRRDFEEVSQILTRTRFVGGAYNPKIAKHAIIGHALFGDIRNAEQIYRDSCDTSDEVHEAMLKAYIKCGRRAEVEQLYWKCRDKNVQLSIHTYADLMVSYLEQNDLPAFDALIEDIRSRRLKCDHRSYACMIKGHMKFGNVSAARATYIEAKRLTYVRYRHGSEIHMAFIRGLAGNGMVAEALEHLKYALAASTGHDNKHVLLDPVFVTALIQSLLKQKDYVTAERVAEWCLKMKVDGQLNGTLLASLVDVYAQSGDMSAALKLLKTMKALPGTRVHPEDLRICGGSLSSVDKSRLPNMLRKPPIITAYSTLIAELARMGLRDAALSLVDEIQEEGFTLTYEVVLPLLRLYALEGDRPSCLQFLKTMINSHGAVPTPDALRSVYSLYLTLYNSSVSHPSSHGTHGDANDGVLNTFHKLVDDLEFLVNANRSILAVAYDAAIDHHLLQSESEMVECLFMNMQGLGVKPQSQTLLKLAMMYKQAGENEKAMAVSLEADAGAHRIHTRMRESSIPDQSGGLDDPALWPDWLLDLDGHKPTVIDDQNTSELVTVPLGTNAEHEMAAYRDAVYLRTKMEAQK